MKRILITLAFLLSIMFTGMASSQHEASAAGCTITPGTPYASSGGMVAYGTFYCNTGVNHTYKLCVAQSGVNLACNWVTTYTYTIQLSVKCYYNGTSGPAPFTTTMYIWNATTGAYVMSGSGGTAYGSRCS